MYCVCLLYFCVFVGCVVFVCYVWCVLFGLLGLKRNVMSVVKKVFVILIVDLDFWSCDLFG